MLNAERKCRRIKSGRITFSPEAALWIRRTQVYRSLLQYHRGLIRNRGNLKRMTRRCGILNCLALLVEDILVRLKVCIKQCDYYRIHGKQYQQKHLQKCLQTAREMEDDRCKKEILAIIQREKDRSFWRRINYSMGKARGESVRRVLVESGDQEGILTEYTTASPSRRPYSHISTVSVYFWQRMPRYALGGCMDGSGTTMSQKWHEKFLTVHMCTLPILIRLLKKSVRNALEFGQ
jgi:hypothetical protein